MNLYYAYRTTTSITIYRDTIQTYPAITICNLNPFQSGNIQTMNYLKQALNSSNITWNIQPTPGQYSIYLVRQAMDVLKATAISNLTKNASFVQDLGYNIDTMIISCYFGGVFCDQYDFYSYFTYDYGYCHVFNFEQTNNSELKLISQAVRNIYCNIS